MTLEVAAAAILIAAALVALNFRLQRLARPGKGSERVAGCCGMALPEEILRDGQVEPEGLAAPEQAQNVPGERGEDLP